MQGGKDSFSLIHLGDAPPVLIQMQDTMQIVSNASQRGRREAIMAKKGKVGKFKRSPGHFTRGVRSKIGFSGRK